MENTPSTIYVINMSITFGNNANLSRTFTAFDYNIALNQYFETVNEIKALYPNSFFQESIQDKDHVTTVKEEEGTGPVEAMIQLLESQPINQVTTALQ